jgi:hypothetical protein
MSFTLVLSTNTVYATNTSGKDYAWAFDSSVIEDGDYELTFKFSSGNIALATFATNGPIQLSLDMGAFPTNYLGGSVVKRETTQIIGLLNLEWRSASVATYIANNDDNSPVYFKSLNRNSNFIRLHLDQSSGALVATGITPWVVSLNFKKL